MKSKLLILTGIVTIVLIESASEASANDGNVIKHFLDQRGDMVSMGIFIDSAL
jgi:hypothetical protein